MKNLLLILLGLLFLASCNINKKITTSTNASIFSKNEEALILSKPATEPMRVLLITNPEDSIILRTKSTAFKVNPDNKTLQHFTERLYNTVRSPATLGVGIAAPQVGILQKIIWIQRFDKESYPFEVYYNPEITKYTELKQDVLEGCLSIPDMRDTTHYRSYAVLLEYDNAKGEHLCEMIESFTAVIFQHEIDHLDGILFTDHLEKEKKTTGVDGF